MTPAWPRYLLFAETVADGPVADRNGAPGWRFMLHAIDSDHDIVASDHEPGMRGDRLALMAVVRGLEALDQPSVVKLVSTSTYVRRGVSRGIAEWRANDWKWEHFGRLTPIRDEDLWRRIDQALAYHRVSCRGWRSASDAGVGAVADAGANKVQRRRLPLTRQEHVTGGVISEPALLVVRGKRRHVVGAEAFGEPKEQLAAAG